LSDETDNEGRYEIYLPTGTWKIEQDTPSGWNQLSEADGDGTYTITVPDAISEVEPDADSDEGLSFSFIGWLLPTAHAAVFENYRKGLDFGNERVSSGGSSSSGTRVGDRDRNNDSSNTPDGEVLGDSTSTPEGQVLGEATSVMPVGAPNTGAGGTSAVQVTLPTLVAILTARAGLRATK